MTTDTESELLLRIITENPGYLEKTGWLRTMIEEKIVDADGNPVPWITYPARKFLEDRITADMDIFEYGSGNSTLWWSSRVASVTSCEHDKEWYAAYLPKMAENTTYILRRVKNSTLYADEILNYRERFDILVIDGRDRVNCIKSGLNALKPAGVVVWDNSDRDEYEEGYEFLLREGFKRLDFWGLGPISTREWCTSVFYRIQNCLSI